MAEFGDDTTVDNLSTTNYPSFSQDTSEDHRELLRYIELENVSSINETISDIENTIPSYLMIEVLNYTDDDPNNNNPLQLSLSGLGAGEYDYQEIDETGATTAVTGADQFDLITPTATSDTDRTAGRWRFTLDGARGPLSVVDWGPRRRPEGKVVYLSQISGGSTIDFPTVDLTVSANAASNNDDLVLRAAVFKVNRRDEI